MKAPKLGDRIIHTDAYDNVRHGTVDNVLSSQFVYISDGDKARHFCMFNAVWQREEKKPGSKVRA